MKKELLPVPEALRRGQAQPWALVRTFSRVTLGETPEDVSALPLDELLEARFFNEEEEIRLFRRDGVLEGASLRREADDRVLEDRYGIENPALGGQITVCRVLACDDDGQTYIAATMLSGWRGKEG